MFEKKSKAQNQNLKMMDFLNTGVDENIMNKQRGHSEEDIVDDFSVQSLELESDGEELGWKSLKPKRARVQKKRQVIVATRTSQRVPRDGIPIATKVVNRAMAKDNISGNSKNPFTILNETSNVILQEVMIDLGIGSKNFEEQLDIFKVEEKPRDAMLKLIINAS